MKKGITREEYQNESEFEEENDELLKESSDYEEN